MILITEFMDEAAVDLLRADHEVHHHPDLAARQEAIPPLLASCRALIVRNRTEVTDAMLAAAPRLSCVGRLGVGLDNIDVAAAEARGVAVIPATGANDLSVAEYVITTAMMLLRGAYTANGRVIAGEWPRTDCAGRELAGKVFGLVGFGGTARRTARLAQALGMTTIATDPMLPLGDPAWGGTARRGLSSLVAEADVVSLHVPLTETTLGMIDAAAIATMKPGAILINAARGGIVDETALIGALKAGHLGGAALDVFPDEPLSADAGARFKGVPNLILTPHIAGVTAESNVRVSRLIAERVAAHLAVPARLST